MQIVWLVKMLVCTKPWKMPNTKAPFTETLPEIKIWNSNSVSKEQSSGYPPFLYDKVVLSEYEFLIIANGLVYEK